LTQRSQVTLAEIMAHPFVFAGRAPRDVHGPLVAAREAARQAGALHPAFPALVQESPTVALSLVPQSDVVVAVSVTLAARALRRGEVVALPWRAPWVSVHPGILRLRGKRMAEAEQAFLDLLHSADLAGEREAQQICAELGLPADCA
ncbi:MAG: hypothetical protein WCP77_20555, partial [Roseococcus sp.]